MDREDPAMISQEDLFVTSLGARNVPSPLGLSTVLGDEMADYVPDTARVLLGVDCIAGEPMAPPLLLERAGPREQVFFDPAKTHAGIVTCGGLCPGINNVVRSIVLELFHKYGVKRITGFPYGFEGLDAAAGGAQP